MERVPADSNLISFDGLCQSLLTTALQTLVNSQSAWWSVWVRREHIQNWKAALNRFTIMFEERMPQH